LCRHHGDVFKTHLRWTVFFDVHADVGAYQLNVRLVDGCHADEVVVSSKECGKCGDKGNLAESRQACGGTEHILLGDEIF